MSLTEVVPGLHQVGLGMVNAYLLQDKRELTLIDTGIGGSAPKILARVGELGMRPQDVTRILVTHLHADHTGSLAELKRQTGAQVYMHPADAALVRQGVASRPAKPAPGLIKSIVVPLAMRRPAHVEPAETDVELADGQDLGIGGGLCAVTAPGHAAGQVVFLLAAARRRPDRRGRSLRFPRQARLPDSLRRHGRGRAEPAEAGGLGLRGGRLRTWQADHEPRCRSVPGEVGTAALTARHRRTEASQSWPNLCPASVLRSFEVTTGFGATVQGPGLARQPIAPRPQGRPGPRR